MPEVKFKLFFLENMSCLAMELLPVMLPGPMKKTDQSRRFFVDVHEVLLITFVTFAMSYYIGYFCNH